MRLFRLLVPFIFSGMLMADDATREWTSNDGKKIEGTIKGLEGDVLTLETGRGNFEVPLSRFSDEDQLFAREWAKSAATKMAENSEDGPGKKVAPTLGNFEDLQVGVWPQYATAELEVEQIEEIETEGENEYIYRTPHFEFQAPDRLSNSVVREFARIFEATYNFVDQMPLGLAPQPSANGFYITKLYMTQGAYMTDGGVPGSAGMFIFQIRGTDMKGMIKVPLSNLGVEYTGTRFIVDHDRRSTTLVHEIVHQVMMRWLATPMPIWLSEGLAEVISSQDYDNGRFKLNSMDRAVADEVTRGQGRDFRMVVAERLMTITREEWSNAVSSGMGGGSANYNSANVLTYYFLKLDGDGDGANLVEYLKALVSGDPEAVKSAQAEFLLRGRSYETLEKDIADAWRSEGLKIEF